MSGPPPDPRRVHELEQFGAAVRDLAPVMARTRDVLEDNGYSRAEAVLGSFRVMELLLERAWDESGPGAGAPDEP